MDEDVASDALDSVLEGFYEVSLDLGLKCLNFYP